VPDNAKNVQHRQQTFERVGIDIPYKSNPSGSRPNAFVPSLSRGGGMYQQRGRVQPTSTPHELITEWEGYELMKVSFYSLLY